MSDNTVAKVIRRIGYGIALLGIIVFLIVWFKEDEVVAGISGIVGSALSGVIFVGFSEVIDLLQHNLDKQAQILKVLQEKPSVVKEFVSEKPIGEVEDIESNLPQI